MSEILLEQILQSKTRTNLVAFFLANPERGFFAGELQKRLGSSTLSSHLAWLVKNSLITTYSKKGKKYYLVNNRDPLWDKLRSSVSKILKKYEDELVKAIKKLPGLKVAVLCGLFSGEPNKPCDILLVGKLPPQSLANFIKAAEKMAGQELNFALFDVKEYQYRKNIFDRFMKDIFEYRHLVVVNKLK